MARKTVPFTRVLSWLTALTVALFLITCMAYLRPGNFSINGKADRYYQNQLDSVMVTLTSLKAACQKNTPLKILKQQFVVSRLAYKRLAVFSEFFNVYETKFLNGPALERVEDGTPDIIIPPQGFQAIEEILYSNDGTEVHSEVSKLVEEMLSTFKKLKDEPGRIDKFKRELVWEAVRSASVRLMTLGITGYDSPIAQNSLTEARATVESMKVVLSFFKDEPNIEPTSIQSLIGLLDQAGNYLHAHNNFNTFDRLIYITDYINPFYKQLVITRLKAGISSPEGQTAVNFDAQSIFQQDFFNINFFSPGKEYWITDKRIRLGKKLFSDPVLSGTKDRSCVSCHQPDKAFTDGLTVPEALDKKTILSRNTPTLWNSALQTRQFYDNRTDILESQLKEVVHNSDEMKGSLAESATELRKSSEYLQLFKESYNEQQPINAFNIANAISSYVRSLISLNSKFDQYILGRKATLSNSEKLGFNLFAGKAKCATCHFIPLFNGLVPPDFVENETEVLGVPKTKQKTKPVLDSDLGKFNISTSRIHKYSFKTPTLRNIELTGPYMHNGVFNTLEEVMDFYNEGGGAGLKIAPENQTLPRERLNLSKKEISAVIAFMKTLTDDTAKKYKP